MTVNRIGVVSVVAALALSAAAAAGAGAWRSERADAQALAAQARTIAQLQEEVTALQASDPDWAALVAAVEPSVVTVETDEGLGSGWVARSDARGSDIVTNFHVVASGVAKGVSYVKVVQFDQTWSGEIAHTDRLDDLALVHVSETLKPMKVAALRPKVGTKVMAFGSPLGLSGTASAGVVSAFRSLFGSDYLQFTAPISPGNSGGPVVDGSGRVVGIATGKIVMDGAEALAFAIPVQVACGGLVVCAQA
jgi:putative serine protease PepD